MSEAKQKPSRAVVVGFAIIALLLLWQGVRSFTPWIWPWEAFPSGTRIQQIIVAQRHGDGFGPSCVFVAARLWPGRKVDDAYVRELIVRDEGRPTPEWRPTPAPHVDDNGRVAFLDAHGRELEAMTCRDFGDAEGYRWMEHNAGWEGRLREALSTAGSYYTTFNEGEGIIVIDAQRRIAYYKYGEL